jgi:hypothetical protein
VTLIDGGAVFLGGAGKNDVIFGSTAATLTNVNNTSDYG